MSNKNINISASNVVGNCDLKCSYNFKYSASTSTAKNDGQLIDLTYDSTSVPPVVFNESKYVVEKITIVSPSIHLFNNEKMPGEIIITHTPVKGGNTLKVCIPFISSSDTSTSSSILTDIINKVSTNAPTTGDTTNVNIANFTLQNIVPKKPFFTYEHDRVHWIVYGNLDAIPLSSSTLSTLKQIIKPFPIPTYGKHLFYNSKGPISGVQIGDGLYISCQPTGSSVEETEVEYEKQSTSAIDFNSPTFMYMMYTIVGILLFIGIFYGINSFYGYLSRESVPELFHDFHA
jgi:hypothetical protein